MRKVLYNYKENPPENAWQNIANTLSNKPKNKINKYYWAIFALLFVGISTLVFTEISTEKIAEKHTNFYTEKNIKKYKNIKNVNSFSSPNSKNKEQISSKNSIAIQEKIIQNEFFIIEDKNIRNNKNKNEIIANANNSFENQDLKPAQKIINQNLKNETILANNIAKSTTVYENTLVKNQLFDAMLFNKNLITSNPKTTQTFEDLSDLISPENFSISVKNKMKNWQVQTYFSPIIVKSAQHESALIDELKEYHNKFENNSLFGAAISYKLNNDWILKSGIEYFNISQITDNVSIAPIILLGSNLSNITYSDQFIIQPYGENSNSLIEFDGRLIKDKGKVSQEIAYAGIPVQVGYRIFGERKINLYGMAGISSYFLAKNKIQFQNETYSSDLGEANNLNNVVFSSQLGFDFQYNLNQNWNINIQPQMKYLFNTTNSDIKTQPVIIGINAGISYDF